MSDKPCSSKSNNDNGFESDSPEEETPEVSPQVSDADSPVKMMSNRLRRLEVAVDRLDEKVEDTNDTLEAIAKHFNVPVPQRRKKTKPAPKMSVEAESRKAKSKSPPVQSGRVNKEAREKLVKDMKAKVAKKKRDNDEFELDLIELRKRVAALRKAVAEHPNNPINKKKQDEPKQNGKDASK